MQKRIGVDFSIFLRYDKFFADDLLDKTCFISYCHEYVGRYLDYIIFSADF